MYASFRGKQAVNASTFGRRWANRLPWALMAELTVIQITSHVAPGKNVWRALTANRSTSGRPRSVVGDAFTIADARA
jgi:hypothetical protein